MKIAIPSDDKVTLSQHFGRTQGFMIYHTENNQITGEEYRLNNFTGHALGHHHDHEHQSDHMHHSHGRILGALQDCEVVIAGGMGPRLYEDLTGSGKEVYISRQSEVRKAVELFLANELRSDKEACSNH